ncbi:MAG: radical SAM family heme chaperone HemW, partial [Prevotella sp.]|nr:radical SAM family heme chaperone HemW [Prevotella sp.]
ERRENTKTIYLGGGTPSQLTIPQLRQIFLYINKVYARTESLSPREVTIEMNPDDVTAEYAASLPLLGINRVSMGAQTFDDSRLRFLNRRHSAAQVSQAVTTLRAAGISNISIDLMYGFPGETLDAWQRDIDAALALDVEHISAYCLSLEPGTPLYEQVKNGNVEMGNEEAERQMYELLIDRLTAAGYEHYEISNFAQPGRRSRHNSSYWTDVPYIGLGAAAHSYDGRYRQWNVSDLDQYIKGIASGTPDTERELIDEVTRFNDRVMLSLRTCEGLDISRFSPSDREYLLRQAGKYIDNQLLRLTDDHLILTRQGLFVSDMVMSDLMKEN